MPRSVVFSALSCTSNLILLAGQVKGGDIKLTARDLDAFECSSCAAGVPQPVLPAAAAARADEDDFVIGMQQPRLLIIVIVFNITSGEEVRPIATRSIL